MRGCKQWLVLSGVVLTAASLRAGVRALVTAESDSFQSLTYGMSAFCQAAEFPFALTEINSAASELLFVPNLAGVDVQGRLAWAVVLDDCGTNVADHSDTVAILPTRDDGAMAMRMLAAVYSVRMPTDAEGRIWRFGRAVSTTNAAAENAFTLPEKTVFAAIHKGYVVVASSRDGVAWGLAHVPAPNQAAAKAGQVRFEINPVAVAAMLKQEREAQTALPPMSRPEENFNTDGMERLLADLASLSLVLDATAEGVTAQITAQPRPDSRLAKIVRQMRPPAARMWRLAPERAPVVLVAGGPDVHAFLREYGLLPENKLPVGSFTNTWNENGDTVVFVDHTAAGALYGAGVRVITNRAAAWAQMLAAPQALLPLMPTTALLTNGMRMVAGCRVQDFSFQASKGFRATAPNFMDVTLIVQPATILSVAITNDLLVSVLGTSNAMAQVLQRLQAPAARDGTRLPGLSATPCFLAQLGPVALMRMIVEALPSENEDPRVGFPQPGDSITAAMLTETNDAVRLVLRVPANEVAGFQKAAEKTQMAIGARLSHMATEQMFQKKDGSAPPEKPLPPPRRDAP